MVFRFCKIFRFSKGKLKMIKINSDLKKEDQIHSRRILSEAILEKDLCSNFFNNYELLKIIN